jgi:hypothetical protein
MFSGLAILHSARPEEATVHMLIEGFSVFGDPPWSCSVMAIEKMEDGHANVARVLESFR